MKHDLDPITLDQLAHGSRMSACCDEAELRANHDTLGKRMRRPYEARPSAGFFVICVIVAAAYIAVDWYIAGPPLDFNPFNR